MRTALAEERQLRQEPVEKRDRQPVDHDDDDARRLGGGHGRIFARPAVGAPEGRA
jgi:hypothetical protein